MNAYENSETQISTANQSTLSLSFSTILASYSRTLALLLHSALTLTLCPFAGSTYLRLPLMMSVERGG